MAAIQPNEERYEAVNKEWIAMYGDEDDEINEISKGYEEIRKMIDHQIIRSSIKLTLNSSAAGHRSLDAAPFPSRLAIVLSQSPQNLELIF